MTAAEQLYHKYLTVAAEVNHPPLSFIEWLSLCDYLVPTRFPMGFPLSRKPIDAGAASHKKPRKPEQEKEEQLLADVRAVGLFIGELRPDGSVCPPRDVRRQAAAVDGKQKSHLTARTCRACGDYLPASKFSKQANGRRAVCRKWDNSRRRPKLT